MPRTTDLNQAIDALVTARVNEALAPYRNLLDRLAAFAGQAPARRRPGRPAKVPAVAKAQPVLRPRARVVDLRPGMTVRFQQGRGRFEAKIIAVNKATGSITIERTSDGKKFKRSAISLLVA